MQILQSNKTRNLNKNFCLAQGTEGKECTPENNMPYKRQRYNTHLIKNNSEATK